LPSEKVQQPAGLGGGIQAALQFHPAAWEIIVLDVYSGSKQFSWLYCKQNP